MSHQPPLSILGEGSRRGPGTSLGKTNDNDKDVKEKVNKVRHPEGVRPRSPDTILPTCEGPERDTSLRMGGGDDRILGPEEQ